MNPIIMNQLIMKNCHIFESKNIKIETRIKNIDNNKVIIKRKIQWTENNEKKERIEIQSIDIDLE
jgi:hypothetical protein